MKKTWLFVISLVLILAVLGLAGCSTGNPISAAPVAVNNQQEGIWVTGEGKVTAAPDIVDLRLGVEAQASNVSDAQAQATDAMNKIMDSLKANGVDQKDIQTQSFSIQKVTRWDDKNQQEVVIGYRVTNLVMATIRGITKAGTVIDAAAAAGGDLTRVDSISFSIDDPTTFYAQAREKAMNDAKAKATQLANLGGVTLGKPTYISEGTQYVTPISMDRTAVAGAPTPAPTPISPGEMDIILNVQVVYSIAS